MSHPTNDKITDAQQDIKDQEDYVREVDTAIINAIVNSNNLPL